MEVSLASLLASPIASTAIAILVVVIAFKLAFYTIKKVIVKVVLGLATYMVCIHVLNIPMDIGVGIWALTVLLGPIPMVLAALYHGL